MKIGPTKAEKKKCFHCGKRLRTVFKHEQVRIETEGGYRTVFKRVGIWGYGYEANNLFCTLGCGFRFAVKVAKRALELKETHGSEG